MHFSAKSQSEENNWSQNREKKINWSQNREKRQYLFHGTEEEHGREYLWQLGAVSESVECEQGSVLMYSLSPLRYLSHQCEVLQYVVHR